MILGIKLLIVGYCVVIETLLDIEKIEQVLALMLG